MDEISPLVALPCKLGNLISDESVFTSCVDIAGIELITNRRSLFSEPSMTKLPLVPITLENRNSSSSVQQNGVLLKIESNCDKSKDGEDNILVRKRQSESCLIFSNDIKPELKGNDPNAFVRGPLAGITDSPYATNGANSLCIGDSLVLETNLEPKPHNQCNSISHSMKKSESWVSTITSEIVDDLVTVEETGEAVSMREPKRTFSTSLLEVSEEMKTNKQILHSNYQPLWGVTSICGRRQEMEDAVVALPRFVKIPSQMLSDSPLFSSIHQDLTAHLFGVYDGHGGSQVANYCRERLHLALSEEIDIAKENLHTEIGEHNLKDQWLRVFLKCFHRLDNEVGGFPRFDGNISSNHPLPPIAPSPLGPRLWSQLFVLPISLLQIVPNREDECARIEAAGGKVINWDGYRVSGVLAVSRSIGDRYLRPYVVADPEIMFVPRTKEDECLILASDGLWDVMTNEEACDLARRRILLWHKKNGATLSKERGTDIDLAAQDAADYLSQLAFQRGSRDNISVIVVDLKAQRKFRKKA
ncbi:protein phosphatase 2C 7 [Sesamum angolense]|uniref:protein-serine/threonine phosphatase n=1 Tax=Sesamum angolense TaxID=2727404 RepID=A0AAE1WEK4_9LAMI|nr:protein phosphatase 2C 7 [Sesamum angolense]